MLESYRQINKEPIKQKAKCSHCGSEDVWGMSRVVGYFSRISNWNPAKHGEFADRQKGNYDL